MNRKHKSIGMEQLSSRWAKVSKCKWEMFPSRDGKHFPVKWKIS